MRLHKLAFIAAVTALILAGSVQVQKAIAADPAPTQLAVVDIVKLFASLDEKRAGDRELKQLDDAFDAERTKREQSLKRQGDALRPDNPNALFRPGTKEYKDAQDQLLQETMNYKAFVAVGEARHMMLARLKTVELYRKMNEAIAKYAKDNGIAIVFTYDDIDLDSSQEMNVITSKIAMRKIMYAHPQFDITEKLRVAMNAAYGK